MIHSLSSCERWITRTREAASPSQEERAILGDNSYQYIHRRCHHMAADNWLPVERAVAVTAVISPIITWEENIAQADALCWESATGTKAGLSLSALPTTVAQARRILAGESALDVIRGRKVWNFYWSILHPDNPLTVCVDRHVGRAALGWDLGWREVDTLLKVEGTYQLIAEAVRVVARREGLLPLQLQALLWLVMREKEYRQMRLSI